MEQIALLESSISRADATWFRAAIRECIAFGDHGTFIEQGIDGAPVCFDCRGQL